MKHGRVLTEESLSIIIITLSVIFYLDDFFVLFNSDTVRSQMQGEAGYTCSKIPVSIRQRERQTAGKFICKQYKVW